MSTKKSNSNKLATPKETTQDRPQQDQAPTIEKAYGMLKHFAKRKPVTITEMGEAVRQRAKKRHSA